MQNRLKIQGSSASLRGKPHCSETERCLRNDSHTEASWLHQRFGIQHTHTYAHLLTQGNEKYYIFIKARRIYARKSFVAHLQNTEMLQSVKEMKSFFHYPIIPNSRTGHWAESINPKQSAWSNQVATSSTQRRKGKEVATERRLFFQRKPQKQLSEAFIFHTDNVSPTVPAITARTP